MINFSYSPSNSLLPVSINTETHSGPTYELRVVYLPSLLSLPQLSIGFAGCLTHHALIYCSSPLHLDSAFKQQRLPAWQPVLTAGTVLPTFFIIGILFIPVGVGLLYFSDEVREVIIDYTMCKAVNSVGDLCAERIQNTQNSSCTCEIDFTLDRDFEGKVYMYYGLTNYYQNHRRYVKSRDDDQLLGKLSSSPASDCHPFRVDGNNVPIAPCGAIANSLFSGKCRSLVSSINYWKAI